MRIPISLFCVVWLVLIAGSGTCARAQEKVAVRPGVLWMFDLGAGQGYNDNPLGAGRGGYFAQFDPQLSLGQSTNHDLWTLNLQSSVQHFYNFSVADRFSEGASLTDTWQMSRRWSFNLTGNYLHSSDPLANWLNNGQAQPISSTTVVSPNNAFIGPQSPVTTFGGSSTIAYQAGRYTQLTFGGDYFNSREYAPQLPNMTSHSFRAGYSRMVRRNQTIGLDYSAQFLDVANPSQDVTTHSLLLSYSYEWKPGREIALFAGPQYSFISADLTSTIGSLSLSTEASEQVLSYSLGSTLSLMITRENSFQLMATRRVSGTGGISGARIQNEGQLGLSRRFNKRFSGSTGGFYSDYQQLGNLPILQPRSWGAFNRAQLNLTPNNSISVEYDYFHQTLSQPSLAALFSSNRALIEYHYSFGSLHGQR
jgi:hypothetical protein